MSDEAEKDVVEGSQVTPEEKYVPLTKYVGVKEMLSKRESRLNELETEVKNLGEQLKAKSEVDPEEFKKIKEELEQKKDLSVEEFNRIKTELEQVRTQELTALKTSLTKAGFTEDELKDKSPAELTLLLKGLEKGKGQGKPGADLSSGGMGSDSLSPTEKIKTGLQELKTSQR